MAGCFGGQGTNAWKLPKTSLQAQAPDSFLVAGFGGPLPPDSKTQVPENSFYIFCSVTGISFGWPFLIFTWSEMPSFFSYPTPILTFVAFFIFASLVVWKDCLGAYLAPRQRWDHPYAKWLCLFLQCFLRIATVNAGTLASKRLRFTLQRVACCDRGIYIGCIVTGIIF